MKAYELAKELRVSRLTIYRWIKLGLPHIRVRFSYRFNLDEVKEWMQHLDTIATDNS